MRRLGSPVLNFLLVSHSFLLLNCGVKTSPTPLIRSKNELLDYAVQVEATPTPTPSETAVRKERKKK